VISLTGGEPFMLDEFPEYYQIARRVRPLAHVNISTNGFYTDRTIRFLETAEPGTLSVTISYDGVRSHDLVRGVTGSRAHLLATAIAIRDRFPAIPLSLKLTVNNDNYGEVWDTAEECRELGIPFRFKTLEKLQCHQNRYPSEIRGPDYSPAIRAAIREQAARVIAAGDRTNRRYLARLVRKFSGGAAACTCSPRTLFLGVDGYVFLCRKKNPIGNVFDAPFDTIWRARTRRVRVREMRVCSGDPMELGYSHE
jgi:MoaA/NifB/PqqE/SkfB family radical SAM enzyme